MRGVVLDGLTYLNNIGSSIAVFEPLFNSKKEVYGFNTKFLNECFIKEFNIENLTDGNCYTLSTCLKGSLLNSFTKLEQVSNTITTNVHIGDKIYKINTCKFTDGCVMCTFYHHGNLFENQECLKYKKIIDNAMDIILIVDKNGKIVYGNQKAVETYGYTYDELMNLSVFDLRNEDIREYAQSQLKDALKYGTQFETFHYNKDGSRFPVEVKSIYSSKESKDRVISIIRDITNIENIAKDAKIFSTSLDIFEDAIIGLTKDFKISHWSKGAENKLGYSYEEMVGKGGEGLVADGKMDEFLDEIKLVLSGKTIKNFETKRIHKNGNVVDVSISISPVYDIDGIFIGAVGVYKDISEKNMLIETIKEYENRWRFALEGGQFGVCDWNVNNNHVFYSNKWKEMLGYSDNEITDSYKEWESRVHPDDLHNFLNNFNMQLKEKDFVSEYRLKCKNDTYKWIRTRGKVISYDNNGDPLRIIATNEDITESILIEQELKENNKQLKLLKEEADKANKAKSLFLANMSHEIRTTMNGILATIQILQLTSLSTEYSKYIKMLKESSDMLLAVINNLLDVSKIESDNFKLNHGLFDLKETINSVYNNLLVSGNSKGLDVSYYLDPCIDSEVYGDELRLKQVLTNITNNAVKFTEHGYVSLRAKLIHVENDALEIEFRIKDSGIGIEDSFKEKIFHNFSQGDLSTRKKYVGTGLGLVISKQLATLMNGDIWFESTVGQGTTFYFTCKLKKYSKKNHDMLEEKNKITTQEFDKVILCVEDNLINQEVLASIVKRRGYKYIAAYNGNEALVVLENNKVDLILMDVHMAELNGFETTKIIREREGVLNQIPIIAMTAYAMSEDKDKCIAMGMDDYVSKPLDIEKLYQIIERYLSK